MFSQPAALRKSRNSPIPPETETEETGSDESPGILTQTIDDSILKTEPVAEAAAIELDPIIAELVDATQSYLHAGWLHYIQEINSDTDRSNRGNLEDDTVIPHDSQVNVWIYLDDDLFIQKSVVIQTNSDGDIIQIGVRSGQTSWNSSTDTITHEENWAFEYITQIEALIRKVAKNNFDLNIQEITSELGKKQIQISYNLPENTPLPLGDYDVPVTDWHYVYTFDPETGHLLMYQEWVTLEDGSQRLAGHYKYLDFTYTDTPPEEILEYLSALEPES